MRNVIKCIPGAKWFYRKLTQKQDPHGPAGIRKLGHREYVGGYWEQIGKLQFDFLVKEGLRPSNYFLDVACGRLRGGVRFIPYLDAGHYLGIDKEESLIQAGITELGRELYEKMRPQLIASGDFEFEKFGVRPDIALAQSLFTHLPPALIETCFRKLRRAIGEAGAFYATFSQAHVEVTNPESPHDRKLFLYTRGQMESFGGANGWKPEYIGEWNHPRGQVIVRYRPA